MEDNNSLFHSTLDTGYDFFLKDKWNRKYHFKIATFPVPSGIFSEAVEVIKNHPDNEPRIFHILSDFGSDIEKAELMLKGKIKQGINKRYLEYRDGKYSFGDDLEVAGRILLEDQPHNSKFEYFFHVDGKKISIEQFVGLLEGVEGWNFKFQIFDTTDPID